MPRKPSRSEPTAIWCLPLHRALGHIWENDMNRIFNVGGGWNIHDAHIRIPERARIRRIWECKK